MKLPDNLWYFSLFKTNQDTMLELPRFSVLLRLYVCLSFAFSTVVPSTVPVLTNVSVTCHNFKNVLYWNYSEPELETAFNIEIHEYEGEPKSARTNQTSLDVSEYTRDAGNSYYITVEAQPKGSDLNVSSVGLSFSYNEDFNSDFRCVVDFPVLEVSVLPHTLELSFKHPYYVHKDESLNDEFLYDISFNQTQSEYSCFVDDDICTADIHLIESLYGRCMSLHIKGYVNRIPTEISTNVCGAGAPVTPTDWTLILTILVCCVFGLLILIILGIVFYKKLTQPDSQSTIFSILKAIVNVPDRVIHEPEHPTLSEVRSVGETPLLETTDQDLFDTSTHPPDKKTLGPTHFPSHLNTDLKEFEEQDHGEVTEDTDSEDFNSGNSFSGYDSQKFPIDMGQGDIVEAYGPR
ncbi:interferon gamma receptor 1-like isoform X1 [Ictalurus furcatus]|uniref:interferon gamma receptor 1-like isoform X1 n=2 Tax=Ictalurus furcatus TaxID=66913 RepID=UPI0023505392|nr:interferon gamma receptor 1-like isoform X1 [Ictalurus furcatus]